MASLLLAGIVYLLAIREFFTTPRVSRSVVVIGLVLAAVWHVAFLRQPAGPDDDVRRYVWDGRLQRLGYNPYLVVPSDPAFAGLHTSETRQLNNPDLPSPYPAGAQLFFRAVTAIRESTFAMKVAFVVCELAIVFVLLDFLRRTGQGTHLVLAFAWNPLLAIEVAGSGHIDIVVALLLLVSSAALVRRWRATAAVALGLAIAVKFLPVVLLPLYWKRIRIRDAALTAGVAALLYLPFLDHGRIPTGSLGTYVQTFRFNGPVFAALGHVAPPHLLAGFAVLMGLVIATWFRSRALEPRPGREALATEGSLRPRFVETPTSRKRSEKWGTPFSYFFKGPKRQRYSGQGPSHEEDAITLPLRNSVSPAVHASAFAWPMAATLLCAPVVFPWYLLALLPFLTSASTLLIIVWTVSIGFTYIQWHLRALGRPWGLLPSWVMLLEYGCLVITAAIIALRRSNRWSRRNRPASR